MQKNLREQILGILSEKSTPQRPIYLVGGALRDLLLNQPEHDLDFVMPGETRSVAREVANRLHGAFYVMDDERDTTRVVLNGGGGMPEETSSETAGEPITIDFARLRAENLEGDLRARDFTINALAMDVAHPDRLIDPTGGVKDLREKWVRACSEESMAQDPVRVLRAVRMALKYQFRIAPETLRQMRAAAPDLVKPSPERLRDELFKLLEGPRVSLGLRILDQVGALRWALPELESLKGVEQSSPHVEDVWDHTLRTVQFLEQSCSILVEKFDEEKSADLFNGSLVLWLGRFRSSFNRHYRRSLTVGRSARGLLFFSALYHDVGKPLTRTEDPDGRVRFLGHAAQSARLAAAQARHLALSSAEIDAIEKITGQHMRVHDLAHLWSSSIMDEPGGSEEEEGISRRTIYRFFRATGAFGVDLCLLSLADTRATYGVTLPQDVWTVELKVCRKLLEAYWENHETVVDPARLLSGDDLIHEFHLKPGPEIGKVLTAIREAQAAGEIQDRAEAELFVRRWLEKPGALIAEEEGRHGNHAC